MPRPMTRWVGCPLLLVIAGCGSVWTLPPRLVRKDLPDLPTVPELDYAPMIGMAHAALPLYDARAARFRGSGRIWLKGSAACRTARLPATGASVALEPPYHTAMIDAPAGPATVEFIASDGSVARTVVVTVPDAAALECPGVPFSALFFGDFQPFVIDEGAVCVNAGEEIDRADDAPPSLPPTTLVALRAMFERAANGTFAAFPRPAFACGVGDQVYVEGDYHAWDRYEHDHPMSAWTIEAQPRPRVSVGDLPRFLDTCYRGHWSFAPFERVLQACPAVMTWDDHDIRDGWGSQGDEHVYRDSWFRVFRDAYIAHQLQRGPRGAPDDARVDAPLAQSFAIHGVPAFVLDLRSCRDIAVPQVIGPQQWRELRAWFAALDPQRCRHYLLVTSVPLFFRVAERAGIAAAFSEETRDDLLDTWTSEPNEPEWKQLVAEIAQAGARGLRGLIVSGDYHVNSLCRVTAARAGGEPQIVAYELIASGLAADGYSDWKQKMAVEGWFLRTPIELPSGALDVELGFADPCPSFGGLEFRDGEVAAHLFQARADGCYHERVPLDWAVPAENIERMMQRGRVRLDDGGGGR